MGVAVLLGRVCYPGRMEIEGPNSLAGLWLEAIVGRFGSDNLTREGFERLLALLDPEAERAGERYQTLHQKLVKLFEWRGAPSAESLADETIDRVIGKLGKVEIRNVVLYALGVAHNVLKESRHAATRNTSLDELPTVAVSANPSEDEKQQSEQLTLTGRFECLDECMGRLPMEERKIIIGYYQNRKSDCIRHRREMAQQLGISLSALRVQTHRIRGKLAECVHECLAKSE